MSATPTVAPVRVVHTGLAQDLRGVKVVWVREMLRFAADRVRFVSALVQPMLFLFVLGTGLSSLTNGGPGAVNLRTFLFPGVLATSTVFTAVFSAVSIVWDREFGFLREMLVAPIRRNAIVVGKALGGATVATLQSVVVLALAGLAGVPYHPLMILAVLGVVFLLSLMLVGLGLFLAVGIQQMQTMMGVVQMAVVPLSFLSGAMYPIAGLPAWLKTITLLNPVTYGVHPVREIVFHYTKLPPAAQARMNAPITWGSWVVPIWVQLGIVVVVAVVLLAAAAWRFERVE